jgi:hypothetical protein
MARIKIGLTDKEMELISLTAKLWNKFLKLPSIHPSDNREMERDIHNIQNRILSRLTVRVINDGDK